MRLLIDIDDTLSVTAPRWSELTEKYMKKHRIKRIKDESNDSFALEDSFGLTEYQRTKWLCYMHDEIHYETLEPVKGAKEFLSWCKEVGHEVTFVTARPPYTEKANNQWFCNNFDFSEPPSIIYATSLRYSGILSLFEAGYIDVLIDNSEKRCREVQLVRSRAILFTGVQVNKQRDCDMSMLPKAENFEKVKEILGRI